MIPVRGRKKIGDSNEEPWVSQFKLKHYFLTNGSVQFSALVIDKYIYKQKLLLLFTIKACKAVQISIFYLDFNSLVDSKGCVDNLYELR